MVYFLILIVVGMFIVLNLFLAILLSNFSTKARSRSRAMQAVRQVRKRVLRSMCALHARACCACFLCMLHLHTLEHAIIPLRGIEGHFQLSAPPGVTCVSSPPSVGG